MSLIKTVASSVLGSVGDAGNTALQNRGARDVARINEADDSTVTSFNQEIMQQLQQALSKVDKNTLEKITGQVVTDEQMKSLQSMTTNQTSNSVNDTTMTANTTGQEKTTQTVQRGDATQQAALNDLVKNLSGGAGTGNADFQAAMNQVLRSGMPALANINNSAGAFDSTTSALLQQDLAIKAAEAGLNASNQKQQTNNTQLLEALKIGQAGSETIVGDLQRQQQEKAAQQAIANQTTNTNQVTDTSQQNTSNQQSTQNRDSKETGQTSTVTSNQQSSTSAGQQFNDVSKDLSPAPTAGPIASILQGKPVNPIMTALPAVVDSTNMNNLTGRPFTEFDRVGGIQPGVIGTGMPGTGAPIQPTYDNSPIAQVMMPAQSAGVVPQDGANPLAAVLGSPNMTNRMATAAPIAQTGPQTPIGPGNIQTPGLPVNPILGGGIDPLTGQPLMTTMPVVERQAII